MFSPVGFAMRRDRVRQFLMGQETLLVGLERCIASVMMGLPHQGTVIPMQAKAANDGLDSVAEVRGDKHEVVVVWARSQVSKLTGTLLSAYMCFGRMLVRHQDDIRRRVSSATKAAELDLSQNGYGPVFNTCLIRC